MPTPEGLFLLGPDQFQSRSRPAGWPQGKTPHQVRQLLARMVAEDSGGLLRGVVMDPTEQREGEDDADFFARIEREHRLRWYYLVVPKGCKLVGDRL